MFNGECCDDALNGDILVSELEFQSCYYIYFWNNSPNKGINSYSSSYELNSTTTVFIQGKL